MGTSEAAVARLEAGTVDPKTSTIERFAAAVGKRIRWELVDADK
jgi:predicted transcriptional regulator